MFEHEVTAPASSLGRLAPGVRCSVVCALAEATMMRTMSRLRDEMTPYGPLASEARKGPVPYSYWVVADSLAAGARPPSGGLEGIGRLTQEGIDEIVDLAGIDPEILGHVTVRARPIADLGVPSAAEMVSILDTIDRALDAGRAVYVHCLAGVGRTGTVVGCWLVRHRICPPHDAAALIARLRSQAGMPATRSPETSRQAELVESWVSGT